ncbi:NinG recombination protein [uncultured Mediterranean phage uvMED]|nr:NinG recombination protein [uncultured Mediterranean phage uvMED]
MAKKKSTRTQVVAKLDKVFSEYIRRRYAKNDIATCVTCNKQDHWKKLQAGHFMSRKHYSTRWDEENVQVQCSGCNVFRYGEQFKFSQYLGQEKAEELQVKSREIVKFTTQELEEMIQHYKDLLKSFS